MPLPVATWSGKAFFARMARTCASLIDQGIDRWELLIGVSEQHKPVVAGWLKAFRLSNGLDRQQVRLVTCPTDTASDLIKLDRLIKSAQGDWVGFVLAGDRFAVHYVYECLMRIVQRPSVELVYFDDDVLKVRRDSSPADPYTRTSPQFKPDFSPDFLESNNYIGLSFVVKKSRLRQVVRAPWQQVVNFPMQLVLGLTSRIIKKNGFKPLLPAWHDDFPIQRIGQVLRHRDLSKLDGCRQSVHHETSKAALACAQQLLADSLKSRHSGSHCPTVVLSKVSSGQKLGQKHDQKLGQKSEEKVNDKKGNLGLLSHRLKVVWPLVQPLPKVSIIVPTKDQFAILKVCLSSLLDKTAYANYEVLVVDNQTTQSTALRYLSSLPARNARVRVLKYDKPFNYSDINNQAVTQCDGEILLFLNNDVEILDSDWLSEMVRHAIRAEVGCVGAKLLYPDRTIQHAGVSLGMHGVADHMYRGLEESTENDPYGYLSCVRNTGAVTGAVMAVRQSVFETVGGFDAKKLPVAFNDVDLCLKAEMAGYRTVWTPDACLIHHESKTRAPRKSKTIATSAIKSTTRSTTTSNKKTAAHVQVQSHATERSEIAHMRASWGSLLKNKFRVLGQRHEPLRFL